MAALQRQRVTLTGFPGAPGVATFYFLNAATAQTALTDMWQNLVTIMPGTLTAQVETNGDTIEDSTGALVGTWTGAAQLPKVGAYTGGYAAPTGAMIDWNTGIISDGHRIKGRTFVVPIGNAEFDAQGTIEAAALAMLRLQASTFVTSTASNFVVWHRPRALRPAVGTLKLLPAHIGSHATVTSSSVPDKAAVLRSRRD